MQCSRCGYIRFKSSPKCLNCGFDFKKQKSSNEVLGESENVFTVYASAGAKAAVVSGSASSEMNFQPRSGQEMTETEPGVGERYDSPLETQETHLLDSGDFELDLSEMENPNSEDWVMGATLTGDLAEISRFASHDSSENSGREPSEFEVQGLGFDTMGNHENPDPEVTHPEANSTLDSGPAVLDEEMVIPEMEPYARKNDPEIETEENGSPQLKNENIENPLPDPTETSQNEGFELSESSKQDSGRGQSLELENSPAEEGEISQETELELEIKDDENNPDPDDTENDETSKNSIDLQDHPVELDPTIEMEDLVLDLETEGSEVENAQQDSLPVKDLELEDRGPEIDSAKETHPLLPEERTNPDPQQPNAG